jgi:pimeloyl-ACP methyl ester carboxylesterase
VLSRVAPIVKIVAGTLGGAVRFRASFARVVRRDPVAAQRLMVERFCAPSVQTAPTLERLERDSRLYLRWSAAQWREREPAVKHLLDSAKTRDLPHGTERLRCYRWSPAGKPRGRMLLCHGWEGYALNFALLITMAVGAGFEVHAFDHLAHGGSSGRKSGLPAAVAALRVVAASLGPMNVVVGHSLGGGAVAWAVAHRAIEADRMVLLAPFFDTRHLTSMWCKLHLIGPLDCERLREGLALDSGMSLAEFMPEALAPHTHQPSLIIHDPRDRITQHRDSATFVRLAPDAELQSLENVGHIGVLAHSQAMTNVMMFVGADTKVQHVRERRFP